MMGQGVANQFCPIDFLESPVCQLLLPNQPILRDLCPSKNKTDKLILKGTDEDIGTTRKAKNKKNAMYHYILVLLVIGIFILLHSLFSKSGPKRSNDPESIKTIEEKTATLARLINAISIQNEINSGSVTMKEVIAEVLDVRNATLFDTITEKDISDVVKAVKTVGSITDRPAQIINETTEKLNKVLLLGNSTLQTFSISQMFSSLNGFDIHFGSIASGIHQLIENLGFIVQEIESSNPNKKMTVEHYS
uniref:WSN domain-containing protein n=1 Tax=Caenorhabditis japonica TaxID=281687 RepID=A0A8R1IS23_CAEJA